MHRPPGQRGDGLTPIKVLTWRWIVVGAVTTVGLTVVALVVLMMVAGRNHSLQIEAIKTGLSVGAGTGGVFALLLAVRRQWLSERAQRHSEQVAGSAEVDATERRITDLYAKAVEQLGHDKAPVRLGAIYALERLAQSYPAHQQTIVNVLCAYLRAPLPPEAGPGDADGRRLEVDVRRASQQVLQYHLRLPAPGREGTADWWQGIRLDLRDAVLTDLDLRNCQMSSLDLRGSMLNGRTSVSRAVFTGDVRFARSVFAGPVTFTNSVFNKNARFGGASFRDEARFEHAVFKNRAVFSGTGFAGFAGFDDAVFEAAVSFDGARFERRAVFERAAFWASTQFGGAVIAGAVTFSRAVFTGRAGFEKAVFKDGIVLERTVFRTEAAFHSAVFDGRARFNRAVFEGDADFERAEFHGEVTFGGATFRRSAEFMGVTADLPMSLGGVTFEGAVRFAASFPGVSVDLRGARVVRKAHRTFPTGWHMEFDPGEEGGGRLVRNL